MKAGVGQAFAQTQKAYHHAAKHQHQLARRLAHQLGAVLSTRKEVVAQALEVGCGTGFLTHALTEVWQERALAPIQCYWLNDLYRAQLVFNPPAQSLGWLMGDVAQVVLPRALDLVVSSSVLQWVADLPAVMARLQAHLNAQGVLAVSVYVASIISSCARRWGWGWIMRRQRRCWRCFRVILCRCGKGNIMRCAIFLVHRRCWRMCVQRGWGICAIRCVLRSCAGLYRDMKGCAQIWGIR
ncbi:methyltransferase domain-containing protein [Rappaport israeli]|uniref:methyltransferase domain-containing protein n=1 Tax=Rappaport israeli TaxID=1839807 RepID=UPI000930EC09|nr:methyltransferase domain-containing protein [Rappaport israeli]